MRPFQRPTGATVLQFAAILVVWALTRAECLGAEAEPPSWPHINTATTYEVDPDWPQRPESCQWGETSGVAVDGKDRVWVFTRGTPPVQLYDADGKFLRGWGEDIIGKAHFLKIGPAGNIWIADVGRHVVRQFTPEGKLLRTLGTPDEPGCDETHLDKPTDMAITPDGQVFVSDGYGNARVVHFDAQGRFVKAWGKLGTGPGEFSLPHAIVLCRDRLYVADRNNVRVQVFDRNGKFLDEWRDLLVPWGFCVTDADELWVCGSSPMGWRDEDGALGCPPKDQLFMKFAPDGRLLALWTVPKGKDGEEEPGELNWVHALALDSKGNIYATDIIGHRVQKFVRRAKDDRPRQEVPGRVTVDGQPLSSGTVRLVPEEGGRPAAVGKVRKGTYKIPGGVKPGKYRVLIEQEEKEPK